MNWEKKAPKMSVIMPFYNCEKYLDDSIQSILNQSFWDFEFIIINDASTDKSDTVVKKYLIDKRIIYIKNNVNLWIVKNLNHWIKIARWEYIARMDWDDISMLDRFEKQITFLEENKDIVIVWWFVELIDENNNKIWEIKKHIENSKIKNDLFLYSPFIHPSVIIKSSIIKNYLYREKYLLCEDYDLWFRIIYDWHKVSNLDEFILKYRKHSNSSSKNSKIIAKRNFELRQETIRKFNLKLSFKEYIGMYSHYFLGLLLTWKQKEKLEYFIKKIIIR